MITIQCFTITKPMMIIAATILICALLAFVGWEVTLNGTCVVEWAQDHITLKNVHYCLKGLEKIVKKMVTS